MTSAASSAKKILRASFFRSVASSSEWPMMNSAVLMNAGSEDYFTGHSLSFGGTTAVVSHFGAESGVASGCPRMMKQILLCVPAVFAKVFLCERPKPSGVQFSRARKILFAQDPLDPDIDRERAQPLVGKKHHAISNLRAYAWQLA